MMIRFFVESYLIRTLYLLSIFLQKEVCQWTGKNTQLQRKQEIEWLVPHHKTQVKMV